MHILLVLFENNIENVSILKDRINSLGETLYLFNDNIVLIETEHNTKSAYELISNNDTDHNSILIIEVRNEYLGFWGRMNTDVWSWLDCKETPSYKEISEFFSTEINSLNSQIQSLEIYIKDLNEKLSENNKIINNLHNQNLILKEMISKKNNDQ